MPGAVSRTSTLALTNATFPYAMTLANKGWKEACRDDRALALGVNVVAGRITYPVWPRRSIWSTRPCLEPTSFDAGSSRSEHGGRAGPRLDNYPADWPLPEYATAGSAAVDLRNAGRALELPPLGRSSCPRDWRSRCRPARRRRSGRAPGWRCTTASRIINTPCTIDRLPGRDPDPADQPRPRTADRSRTASGSRSCWWPQVSRIDWSPADELPESSAADGGFSAARGRT
jgi:hypothetical protein